MPPVTVTAPGVLTTSTGFTVVASTGGSGDYGTISWHPTGHATLTPAGLAALAGVCVSYHGALAKLSSTEQIRFTGPAGNMSVANADLAAQQTAIAAVLANGSNVGGRAG